MFSKTSNHGDLTTHKIKNTRNYCALISTNVNENEE